MTEAHTSKPAADKNLLSIHPKLCLVTVPAGSAKSLDLSLQFFSPSKMFLDWIKFVIPPANSGGAPASPHRWREEPLRF